MSCNIDHCEILSGDRLTITGEALLQVIEVMDGGFPEDVDDIFHMEPEKVDSTKSYELDPRWRGTWSGNSYADLMETILPVTLGSADIVYAWEGGYFTGVRVRDGVVTRHDVVFTLGEHQL